MVLTPGSRRPNGASSPNLCHCNALCLLCVFLDRLPPGHGQEERLCPGSSARLCAGARRLCLSEQQRDSVPAPSSQWLFGGP